MEVVLVRYVGAGLALALSELSPRVPRACIGEGLAFIEELSHASPPALRPLIDTCVREVLRGWRQCRVPEPVAVQHLEALPAILEAHPPSPKHWTFIFAPAMGGGNRRSADRVAQEMAAEIVTQASSAGALQRHGLLVQVSVILIQRLLEAMILTAEEVRTLAPYAASLFDKAPGHKPAGALEALIGRFAPSLCPEALMQALVAEQRAHGIPDHEIANALETKAYSAQELLREISTLIDSTGDSVRRGQLEAMRAKVSAGALVMADEILTQAEDQDATNPDEVDRAAGDHGAQSLRLLRARLAEVRGKWQEAARHYAVARRFSSAYDLKGRWQLMMRQASALSRHGVFEDDINALFEAAQLHAEAGGLVHELDAPFEWAAAHVELGNLLLHLAKREKRPERYLAAALHFKPAVDVFSREGAMEDWALAQLGLANALLGQGEHQGDPVVLGDAAFAFRAALGMLHAGRSPEEWAEAKSGLGSALVRIAEETGEQGLMDEAVMSLKTALSSGHAKGAKALEGLLGRAYVVMAAEKDDTELLGKAVERLENSLSGEGEALSDAEAGKLLHLLGSSLWALGEASHDRPRLESALQTLASARSRNAAAGETAAAAAIAKEIEQLESALQRLRRSQRQAAGFACL